MQSQFENIFQIDKFVQEIQIQQHQKLPTDRMPYLILMQEMQINITMDPKIILKSFLTKFGVQPLDFKITQELNNFLNQIQQRDQKYRIGNLLASLMPMTEDFDFENPVEVQNLLNNVQKSGLQGVLDYAEENISPDIFEDFENIIKDQQKSQNLLNLISYSTGLLEFGSLQYSQLRGEKSLVQKQPHSQLQSQHIQQIQTPIIMSTRQLEILFDQVFVELNLKVKKDEKYEGFLQKFTEDLQINQQKGIEALKIAVINFASKKIAKKYQDNFIQVIISRYPLQNQQAQPNLQQSQFQKQSLQQSQLQQSQQQQQQQISSFNTNSPGDMSTQLSQHPPQRMSQRQNSSSYNLFDSLHQQEEQGEIEYAQQIQNEQRERKKFEQQFAQTIQDSDNEENKEISSIQEKVDIPSDIISDEEKEKSQGGFFSCGGKKESRQPKMVQGGQEVQNFPEAWTGITVIQIISPKYVKQSQNWQKVFQKWKNYFSREKITEVKAFKYIKEMEKFVDLYKYKDQSKCRFLLVAQLKHLSYKSQHLTDFLRSCLVNDLYMSKQPHYDLFKIIPILLFELNNRKLVEHFISNNLLNYKFQNLIDENSFQGVQKSNICLEILTIFEKITKKQFNKPEILEYSTYYQKDKIIYKIFHYLIECKGQEKTHTQYLFYFEELIVKCNQGAAYFVLYNSTEQFKQYLQDILDTLSFRIPWNIKELYTNYQDINQNYAIPQILKYTDFYGGIGDENFQILRKMITSMNNQEMFSTLCKSYEDCLQKDINLAIAFYQKSQTYPLWPKVFNIVSLNSPQLVKQVIDTLQLQMKQPEILQYIPYFQDSQENYDCFKNICYCKYILQDKQQNNQQSQLNQQQAYESFCYYFRKLLVSKQQEACNLIIQNSTDLTFFKNMFEDLAILIPKILNQFLDKYKVLAQLNIKSKPEILMYESFFQKIKEPLAESLLNLIYLKNNQSTQSQQFVNHFSTLIGLKPVAAIQFINLNRQLEIWPQIFQILSLKQPLEVDQILKQFQQLFEKPEILNYTSFYLNDNPKKDQNFKFCQELLALKKQNPQSQQMHNFLLTNLLSKDYFEICVSYIVQNNYPQTQQLIDEMSTQNPEQTAEICRQLKLNDIKINFPLIILYTQFLNSEFDNEELKKTLQKWDKLAQKIKNNKSVEENKKSLFQKIIKKLGDPSTQGFATEWIVNNEFSQFSYQELLEECAVTSLEMSTVTKNIYKSLQQSYLKKQKSQIQMHSSSIKEDKQLDGSQILNSQLSQNLEYLDSIASQLNLPDIIDIVEQSQIKEENEFKVLSNLQKMKFEFTANQGVEEVKERYFKQLIQYLQNQSSRKCTELFLEKNFTNFSIKIQDQNEFLHKLANNSLEMLHYTPQFYQKVNQDEGQTNIGQSQLQNQTQVLVKPFISTLTQEIGDNQQLFEITKELCTVKKSLTQQNPAKLIIIQKLLMPFNCDQRSVNLTTKFLNMASQQKSLSMDEIQQIIDEISEINFQLSQVALEIYQGIKKQQPSVGNKIFLSSPTQNSIIKKTMIKPPEISEYIQEINGQEKLFNVVKELQILKRQCVEQISSFDNQRNRQLLEQKILYEYQQPQNQIIVIKFLEKNSQNFDWTTLLQQLADKNPKQAYQLFQQIKQYNANLQPPEILEFLPYYDQDPALQDQIQKLLKLKNNEQTYSEYEQQLQEFATVNYEVYRKLIGNKVQTGQNQSQQQLGNVVFMPNFDIAESLQKMEDFYKQFKFGNEKMSQNILKIEPKLIFCPGKNAQTQKGCSKCFTNINNLHFLKCPDCQLHFCTFCYQMAHPRITCEQFYEQLNPQQKIQFQKECVRQKQLQQSEIENRKITQIRNWILDRTDFSSLKMIFFNLLNRGDDWETVIKLINNEIKKQNIYLPFSFNKKLLLYLYLQNSDEIRQYKSIEQHARYNDVPLFYPKWPTSINPDNFLRSMSRIDKSQIQNMQQQQNTQLFNEYTINSSIYLITQPSTSILSFGLNKAALFPLGKSSLLNYVFSKNFQTEDRSPFSCNSIDIDFDNQFRPTRQLAIADVNGVFEKKHYVPFFNLFQYIILHVKYQDIQSDGAQYQEIVKNLSNSPLQPQLLVIVRDFSQLQIHNKQYIDYDQDRVWSQLQNTDLKHLQSYRNSKIVILENLDKIQLKEDKISILDELKNFIFMNLQKISDKCALTKQSILQFFKHYNEAIEIDHIDKVKTKVMNELIKYQDDFFDENIFPCRNLMKRIKNTKKAIWKGTNKQQIGNHQMVLKQLESQLNNSGLSKIMQIFLQEAITSPKWYQIIIDLSREISSFSQQKLTQLKKQKEKIQKEYEEILGKADKQDNEQDNYIKERLRIETERNKANERVEQQIISIEIFWRELFSIFEVNSQVLQTAQIDPLERMFDFAGYGESFEIIDGDNMQVNKQQLGQLAEKFKQQKILVLSILGPQSSGKSTLLNYLFGCQFSSSVGRCTRGVYGSLVKVDRDHLNKILSDLQFQGVDRKSIEEKAFDYLLVLDTEGLQDPAKPNTEFDRTITLFCFSVSQILLINFKGEITREMKKLLEICVYSLHTLRKTRIIGNEVFMVFNQNAHVNDITPLKEQITDMKSNIIQANTQAAQEAELLCSGRDGQVVALGSAFKEDQFQPNEFIWEQWKKKIPQSSFAMDCAQLAENVFNGFLRQKVEWNFSSWLKMAQGIWNFIELYPGLLEFEDIMQLKQENDFREEIEIQKKQHLNIRPTDVVQDQIKAEKAKQQKANLVDIYEKVKQYIGALYGGIQVTIETNMTQFCEERNLDVKLLANKLQQIKDYIANQEKEAMFHLSDYLQKGKTNSYKKEGIVFINDKIKQYQQNFPYQEIDQYLMQKYKKQRQQLSQEQYNLVIQEWAEVKFGEIWDRIIDDLQGKLNLEENCYELIYNHLSEFYKKKEKHIVTAHFAHTVKGILLKEKDQKLSINSLQELQNYYINNIIKDKNQIIFKKKITDKFDQNLNLILRQLDIHGQFLNLKQIFKIKVQRRYIDRVKIIQAFSVKKLNELILKKTNQISVKTNQKSKEKIGDELIVELQGILYKMGLAIPQEIENSIQQLFKAQYVQEKQRAQDILTVCLSPDQKTLKAQIQPDGQNFNYKELKKNYNVYSFFPEFEKLINIYEWEYTNIDQASEFTKQRTQQIQDNAYKNYNYLFDSEEQWVYIDTFNAQQKKSYEQGIEFLITKDTGLGAKQEIYQQLANLARDYLKWEDITEEIWTMLEEKLCLPNSDKQGGGMGVSGQDEWQDISKFSSETVESAFQQVEHIIAKANKDLEYIGQELDQLGQILLHYFGMAICWKILCFSYMNIYLQPIRDLEADKQQWKTTFISQICSDSTKICENLAERIAKDYTRHIKSYCKSQMFTQDFLQDNFSHLKSIFTSQNIMLKTDRQIFNLKVDRNDPNFQDTFEKQIIAYTNDPKPFLELVFEQEWKKNTEQQIGSSKVKYIAEVKKLMKNSEQIIDELIGIFYRFQFKRKQSAKDFFRVQVIGEATTEQLESLNKQAAFYFLKDIFDGKKIDSTWEYKVSDDQGSQFILTPQKISQSIQLQELDLFGSVQWTNQESNLQIIPFPVYFLECLLEELKKFQDKVDISYHDLGIADFYTDCRTQSIGCLKQCNFCGRKCDKPVQIEHKHACEKSHQVRGMKGVKYGKTLSNKICNEIKSDQVVHVENNGKLTKLKWGDICKTSCPDWIFVQEDNCEPYEINFTDVWNKYAEFFCNYYRNYYQEELNYNFITVTQKFHYLILMDDSGSMYGQKWNNAKLACINFIKDSLKYHQNANIEAKISIIKFSNQASLVYGPSELDYQLCEDQLNFEGGGTDFYEPLHIAIQQINQQRDKFNRHIIMMYTDGYARYPAQLKGELNQLPKDVYKQIEFKSWSEQDASVLSDIAKLFVVGEAQDNVKTHELQSAFCEILNAVQHGIAF